MPTFGSVFAGIGGIDLGFDRAGWTCRFQVEIDPACQRVLAHHWPDVPKMGDVKEVTGGRLGGPVDALVGGFPCQDISVAGRRNGLAGQRSGLFYEFVRLAAELSPRWLCIENVPGLLSSNNGRDMGAIVGTLGELGYGYAWRVLDAQYFGVPQRRRRVFIVGRLGKPWSAPAEVLLERESGEGDLAESRTEGPLFADGSGVGAAGDERFGPANGTRGRGIGVVAALTADGVGTCGPDDNQAQAGHLVVDFRSGSTGTDVTGTLQAHHVSYSVNAMPHVVQTATHDVATCVQERDGKGQDSDCTKPLVFHETGARRLTPTECLRLQGFPDGWLDLTPELADSTKYRMAGNAVAVPVSRWIGRRMRSVHGRLHE